MSVLNIDCRHGLAVFPEATFDAVVTDPPYELGFMGKAWDATGIAYDVKMWREVLRVLKPGGHLLSFGGSRTYHRMACAIEDAGFDVRDQLMWLYGNGFPKSRNGEWGGTACKPAHEPIVMARKPLIGTVEDNWRAHGTGALNIDGCRVDGPKNPAPVGLYVGSEIGATGLRGARDGSADSLGRWPANVMHDGSDEVIAAFPVTTSGGGDRRSNSREKYGTYDGDEAPREFAASTGSAARFFYCAKASKSDRGEGNTHPTVKPSALMQYLCRLVTPPGGLILDPFTGSGSTGVAAAREGFQFMGFELSEEYAEIARRRIAEAHK